MENWNTVLIERQAALNSGLRGRKIRQKLSPATFSCMTLGNSANLVEPQFPGVANAHLASLL